jgi:hypothetical protein
VLLAVEHQASNNLGAQVAALLKSNELDRGTYKNQFQAAPAAAVLVPRFVRKPTAAGLQTALVVGIDGEVPATAGGSTVHTDRDLRVKVQFPWQRGTKPLAGGLAHDSASPDTQGNAPGHERSGTWTRLAWPGGAGAEVFAGLDALEVKLEADAAQAVHVQLLGPAGGRQQATANRLLTGWSADSVFEARHRAPVLLRGIGVALVAPRLGTPLKRHSAQPCPAPLHAGVLGRRWPLSHPRGR